MKTPLGLLFLVLMLLLCGALLAAYNTDHLDDWQQELPRHLLPRRR